MQPDVDDFEIEAPQKFSADLGYDGVADIISVFGPDDVILLKRQVPLLPSGKVLGRLDIPHDDRDRLGDEGDDLRLDLGIVEGVVGVVLDDRARASETASALMVDIVDQRAQTPEFEFDRRAELGQGDGVLHGIGCRRDLDELTVEPAVLRQSQPGDDGLDVVTDAGGVAAENVPDLIFHDFLLGQCQVVEVASVHGRVQRRLAPRLQPVAAVGLAEAVVETGAVLPEAHQAVDVEQDLSPPVSRPRNFDGDLLLDSQ
ncbi:MAG: hypothetical protein H7Y08_08635 [Rhizobiaceae bacterium]|nr:hypothetical protein [Rhizobiaceae bacterium]